MKLSSLLIALAMLAGVVASLSAEERKDFEAYVVDDLKTAQLHRTNLLEINFNYPDAPEIEVSVLTNQWVKGSLLAETRSELREFKGLVPRPRVDQLITELRAIDLKALAVQDSDFPWGFVQGWVILPGEEGVEIQRHADSPPRKALDPVLARFMENLPQDKFKVTSKTEQGDHLPPEEVTFDQLQSDPMRYHGKRVCASGVYRMDGETAILWKSQNEPEGPRLALGKASTLVEPKLEPRLASAQVVVDGIFEKPVTDDPKYAGGIVRITRMVRQKPRPLPKAAKGSRGEYFEVNLVWHERTSSLDLTTSESLHFTFPREGNGKVSAVYNLIYYLKGSKLDTIRYRHVQWAKHVDFQAARTLADKVALLDLKSLEERDTPFSWSELTGKIEVVGREIKVNSDLKAPVGVALREALDAYLATLPEEWSRPKNPVPGPHADKAEQVVQGDHLPPQDVTFEQLKADPDKYNGKRIRIDGYYNFEFEGCYLIASKDSKDDGFSLWTATSSALVPPILSPEVQHMDVTVEGTYHREPGFNGSIERVTRMEKRAATK